ncbi:FecR domain-containing protein [Dyadobacter sp. CY327]|uniref:FecR family protein n=1 Tax=Dyadobacter sp. CY327 TaxID=2907301 RepID=UPI001F3C74E2|nr:FecR domain-containing protein [Dyadobacter sp. CY327]MCE7070850.1 FecR domain-containing protein [Dyadobacter sp. CY327]
MTSQYQHIRQLYFENLTGTISEEDYVQLQTWLETDSDVRAIWSALEEESRQLNMQAFVNNIEPEKDLGKIRPRNSVSILHFSYKLAAAMLAIATIWYFLPRKQDQLAGEVKKTEHEKPAESGITLTTPNGKAVTLTKDGSQTMELGDVRIDNKSGTLTYSGGNRETTLNELHIPAKENYEIVLADGTKVSLNSETKLRFPFHFGGSSREVYVEGEAFFEVKKDPSHPFIVHTSLADMVVTGTSFNVNTYDRKLVKTALVEGKVQIRAGEQRPIDLLPGFEATANTGKKLIIDRFDADEVLSWRAGLYYFHNQPLEQLSSFIARWYGIEVVFDREQLRVYPVSGLLEKGRLDEFLTDLKITSGISHHFEGTKLHLK